MSSYDYLQEGFDPHSLKISELRRILTENTIAYPSSSKKKELIKLYDEFVVPMIPELREKYGISKSDNNKESDIEVIESNMDIGKKRKLEDNFSETFHSRSPSVSSVSSIEERVIKESRDNSDLPITPKRKKTKYDNEGYKTTPILQKVATKKVSESLNKNITSISEFDITDSSMSEEELNKKQDIPDGTEKENLDKEYSIQNMQKRKPSFDFSYKRVNLRHNLESLKVSSEYAEHLQKVVIENEKGSNVTKSESPDDFHQTEVLSEFDNKQFETSIMNEDINGKGRLLNSPTDLSPENYSFSSKRNDINELKETIVPKDEMPVSSNDLITTPDLPTSHNVIASEKLTEKVRKEMVNVMDEDLSQTENVSLLMNSTNRFDSANVIDLEDSGKKPKDDIIDLEEVENEIEGEQHTDDDFNETTVKDSTNLSIENSDILIDTNKSLIFRRFLKIMFKIFLWLIFGVLLLFILWFYQNAIYTGYCGQQQHFLTFQERYPDFEYFTKIDSLLEDYKPNCIPCPENGICFPYMKLKCKPEYKVERSSIDIFGLFPFKNKCVKDDKKKELINQIVSKSLDFLRLRNAQMACGESKDDIGSGIGEDDLFNIFQESKTSSIDDDEFQNIWEQVVELLQKQPDIIYRHVSTGEFFNDDNKHKGFFTNKLLQIPIDKYRSSSDAKESLQQDDFQGQKRYLQQKNRPSQYGYFRSTSKKYITLKCRFELEIIRTYQRFKYFIWSGLLLILLLRVIQIKVQNYYLRKSKIKMLTKTVIEKLKKNKIDTPDVPYLSSVQLRDVLMNEETNLKIRNAIWNEVTKNVESNNTNIKSSLLEIHGDMMRCWEWIGPIENKESKKI